MENEFVNKKFEGVTDEQFTELIIKTVEKEEKDPDKKRRFSLLAQKITQKYNECKENAIELLKDAKKLDEFLERVSDKLQQFGTPGKKLAYIPDMVMLVRSYAIKEYTDISLAEIVAIIAALIYFVSPLDVIPDSIPGIGILDDALVVAAVIEWCDEDIERYMDWRKNR